MKKPIFIKAFSALLNLFTFLVPSIFVLLLNNGYQSGDTRFFFIWTIPLSIGLAICGGPILNLFRTNNIRLRLFLIFTIALLITIGWVCFMFYLWGGMQNHPLRILEMPVVYYWLVGGFFQLLFLDRRLPKPAKKTDPIKLILSILAFPLILISLYVTILLIDHWYSSLKYSSAENENTELKTDALPIGFAGRHVLETYFSTQQIEQLQNYTKDFQNIGTAHDLHKAYQTINKIHDGLSDSLTANQERNMDSILDFDTLSSIIPGINFTHYEGAGALINPELSAFKKKAESTPEKSDDDFIAVMIAVYGSEKYFSMASWINQTRDYGGTNLLGDETEWGILYRIQAALSSSKEFSPELNEIRNSILDDILNGTCYEYKSAKIIAELQKIVNTITLSADEYKKLNTRIEEFKKPVKSLQVDCANRDCTCGG